MAREIPESGPYLFSGYSLEEVAAFLVSQSPEDVVSPNIQSALRIYKTREAYEFGQLGKEVGWQIARPLVDVVDEIADHMNHGRDEECRRVSVQHNMELGEVLITIRKGGADLSELINIVEDYKRQIIVPIVLERAKPYLQAIRMAAVAVQNARMQHLQSLTGPNI